MSRRRRKHHRGIPTWYRGVRMRSRLEARWAAAFDWLGWPWEYEPAVEVEGWIPDFAVDVDGLGVAPWLAECKPALDHPSLEPARRKVEASGWRGPVLVLGAAWGVALAAPCGGDWGPAHVAVGSLGRPTIRRRPEPDELQAWWLRLAWVSAGNQTQWRKR